MSPLRRNSIAVPHSLCNTKWGLYIKRSTYEICEKCRKMHLTTKLFLNSKVVHKKWAMNLHILQWCSINIRSEHIQHINNIFMVHWTKQFQLPMRSFCVNSALERSRKFLDSHFFSSARAFSSTKQYLFFSIYSKISDYLPFLFDNALSVNIFLIKYSRKENIIYVHINMLIHLIFHAQTSDLS